MVRVQSPAFLKSELQCWYRLKQRAQNRDLWMSVCPFTYCSPLTFLGLESHTSFWTRLFSHPVCQCVSAAQCVTYIFEGGSARTDLRERERTDAFSAR